MQFLAQDVDQSRSYRNGGGERQRAGKNLDVSVLNCLVQTPLHYSQLGDLEQVA